MPRLNQDSDMQKFGIGKGGFAFTGARLEKLGATEYTLVTVAVDVTGSVSGFERELRDMLMAAVDACKKSPRSDNILVRTLFFSDRHPKGISEIHGFKPLADIDPSAYPDINAGGMTPLCDAVYSSLGATNVYAEALRDQDYGVNGIFFVITDGGENASVATMAMVKDEQEKARKSEKL
ncbi:MAG: hypothetical protein HYT22_04115, partial [Candidatus Niyogibacteria bacterium]|nr:hypothetical protein [Candidatus Niyogibacteria bacterium]